MLVVCDDDRGGDDDDECGDGGDEDDDDDDSDDSDDDDDDGDDDDDNEQQTTKTKRAIHFISLYCVQKYERADSNIQHIQHHHHGTAIIYVPMRHCVVFIYSKTKCIS